MEDKKQPTTEHEMDFNIHLQDEIEKQFIENELDDMISSDDVFPSTEEELFMKIQEDERNDNT